MCRIRPVSINIMGIPYQMEYVREPIIQDGATCGGQIDFWNRKIKIAETPNAEDMFQTILHEVLHGIANAVHMEMDENSTDILAGVIMDTFCRNGWIKEDEE